MCVYVYVYISTYLCILYICVYYIYMFVYTIYYIYVCVYTIYMCMLYIYIYIHTCVWGPPWWLSGKEPTCQAGDTDFDPCIRKMPCRSKWQPTPVFLLGKSHGRGDPLQKTRILGKIEGKRRRGQLRMSWLMASLTQWT